MVEISKEEFLDWKTHPVTEYFFKRIRSAAIELMKDIGEGKTYNSTSVDQTALETSRAFGSVEALQAVLEIDFEEE